MEISEHKLLHEQLNTGLRVTTFEKGKTIFFKPLSGWAFIPATPYTSYPLQPPPPILELISHFFGFALCGRHASILILFSFS